MNLKMISDLVVKAYYQSRKQKGRALPIVGTYKDKVVIAPDNAREFFIDKDKCIFNLDVLLEGRNPMNFENMILPESNYKDAYKADDMLQIDKRIAVKIANDEAYQWINSDFLKPFEKTSSFKIIGEKYSILVYEYDELVGVIYPIKVDK